VRYLVSPEFSRKLAALGPVDIRSVSAFLQSIDTYSKTELLEGTRGTVSPLGEGVYVARVGKARVYLTFGNDADGEYALLLDVTTEQARSASPDFFASKNPKTNAALNPRMNPEINPRTNANLNPRLNANINPRFNANINPRFNASINPRFNASINPRFNASLNPAFNSSINPRTNWAFGGPYLYNSNLQQEAYLVRANEDTELMFDLGGNHVGELVRVDDDVRVQFNADNEWQGYVVRANNDVSLRYNMDGEWIGIIA